MKQRRSYHTGRPHRRTGGEFNRGYESGASHTSERSEKNITDFDPHFPPATLLQEYEYATDGAANKLLDMAKEEQQHRFTRELAEDRFNKKTIRISQFFGAVAFLIILIETFMLFSQGREQMGLILFFGACGTGLLSALITASCSGASSKKACRTPTASTGQDVKSSPASSARSGSNASRSSYNAGHQGGGYRGNGEHHRRGYDRSRNRRRSQRPEGANQGKAAADQRPQEQ